MAVPKKVSHPPIVEAVAETRFENELSSAVLFGKLYTALSKDFQTTEQLPILQIPVELRERQPDLRYAPHYRFKNDKYLVNIGQRVLSVNRICTKQEYEGWDEYFTVIKRVFNELAGIDLISEIQRASIRYINFIEWKLNEAINLELNLFNKHIKDYRDLTLAFSQDLTNDTKRQITIATNAKLEAQDFKREGLVVTIEAYKDVSVPVSETTDEIDRLHNVAKEGFFGALKDKYLESLKPVYE